MERLKTKIPKAVLGNAPRLKKKRNQFLTNVQETPLTKHEQVAKWCTECINVQKPSVHFDLSCIVEETDTSSTKEKCENTPPENSDKSNSVDTLTAIAKYAKFLEQPSRRYLELSSIAMDDNFTKRKKNQQSKTTLSSKENMRMKYFQQNRDICSRNYKRSQYNIFYDIPPGYYSKKKNIEKNSLGKF